MIEFNKKSWHYRLVYELFDWTPIENFCIHWRRVVIASIISTALALWGLVTVMAPVLWLIYGIEYIWEHPQGWFLAIGLATWIIIGIALALVAFIFVFEAIRDWRHETREKTPKKPPGLVATWVAARKAKICPPIRFVK